MKHIKIIKNFKKISFEQQIIFWCHLITIFLCFFPWLTISDFSGYEIPTSQSAFEGHGFLIGTFIFMLSLLIVGLYINQFANWKNIQLPISESKMHLAVGIEQIIFLVLMWSVLYSVSREFDGAEISFGFYGTFVLQVGVVTSAFLNHKNSKIKG